jgi:hypothetical protein
LSHNQKLGYAAAFVVPPYLRLLLQYHFAAQRLVKRPGQTPSALFFHCPAAARWSHRHRRSRLVTQPETRLRCRLCRPILLVAVVAIACSTTCLLSRLVKRLLRCG